VMHPQPARRVASGMDAEEPALAPLIRGRARKSANTPVCRPPNSDMAESFVNTFKPPCQPNEPGRSGYRAEPVVRAAVDCSTCKTRATHAKSKMANT